MIRFTHYLYAKLVPVGGWGEGEASVILSLSGC
jgi:hypothetical protein